MFIWLYVYMCVFRCYQEQKKQYSGYVRCSHILFFRLFVCLFVFSFIFTLPTIENFLIISCWILLQKKTPKNGLSLSKVSWAWNIVSHCTFLIVIAFDVVLFSFFSRDFFFFCYVRLALREQTEIKTKPKRLNHVFSFLY